MEIKNRKARTPVQERGIETRTKILDAAKVLFARKGFHGTNSKEIAAEAGVAIGTFYSYFDEKKPLFIEIIRNYYREISERAIINREGDPLPGTDVRSMVHVMIRGVFDAHNIDPDFHRVMMSMIYSDREIRAIQEEEEEKVIRLITGLLSAHRESIRVTDIEAAARIIHRSAEEVMHSIRIFGARIETERLIAGLEDMVSRYLFE